MKKQLNRQELAFFFGQLSMILHAGVSVLEGIIILKEDASGQEGEEILAGIQESLEMKGILWESLKEAGVFPDYAVHMTEVGERCGTLEEVFSSLSSYYEREDEMLKGIRDSLAYPAIMLAMLCGVLVVLAVKVMPVFNQVFQELGTEMTGLSRAVLHAGTVLGRYASVFMGLLAAVIVFLVYLCKTAHGKRLREKLLLLFPPARKISEQISCSSFAGGLSIALRSGLDMEEGFLLVSSLIQNPEFLKKTQDTQALLSQGAELPEALKQSRIFSGVHARMISVGFKTGQADAVLEKVAEECQNEADEKIQNAVSALEPALVAVLSVMVGLILLSVMLPLAGILSGIG